MDARIVTRLITGGLGVLLALASSGACAASGGGPNVDALGGGHGFHDPADADHDHGEHADHHLPLPDEFVVALEEVETERAREILADGIVTVAEVADLRQLQVDCLVADGFDAVLRDGALEIRETPENVGAEGVAPAVEACLGDLEIVGPLATG